jgi:hypothetical protein
MIYLLRRWKRSFKDKIKMMSENDFAPALFDGILKNLHQKTFHDPC